MKRVRLYAMKMTFNFFCKKLTFQMQASKPTVDKKMGRKDSNIKLFTRKASALFGLDKYKTFNRIYLKFMKYFIEKL